MVWIFPLYFLCIILFKRTDTHTIAKLLNIVWISLSLSLYSEEGITEYAYLCASNYKMRNLFWSYILVWCGKEIVWISHLVFCNSTGSMTDRQKDQNKISHFAIECVMIHSWRAEVLAAWWPNAKKRAILVPPKSRFKERRACQTTFVH